MQLGKSTWCRAFLQPRSVWLPSCAYLFIDILQLRKKYRSTQAFTTSASALLNHGSIVLPSPIIPSGFVIKFIWGAAREGRPLRNKLDNIRFFRLKKHTLGASASKVLPSSQSDLWNTSCHSSTPRVTPNLPRSFFSALMTHEAF